MAQIIGHVCVYAKEEVVRKKVEMYAYGVHDFNGRMDERNVNRKKEKRRKERKNNKEQECIPVGCVPAAH